MRKAFKDIPMNGIFSCNGNRWMKTSTRTARLNGNGRVFYFGQEEIVKFEQ